MNIHLSFLPEDAEFVIFLLNLLHNDGHSLSVTDYTDDSDALQKRRSDTEQKIERADLVIGVASQSVFAETGTELRHDWNAILINQRPSFMIVHEQQLHFISHAFTSVRRMMLQQTNANDPVVSGSLHDEFLQIVSDAELVSNFEKFTYRDALLPG